jgi:lipopolysaccharide/colanic/teichoic acid biosynthesis glycosyltransferase
MLERTNRLKPLPLWKKATDLAGASAGLILLSPLMVLVALFIKLASPGPVLFKHKRYGYRGRPLYVWKFRSMHVNCDTSQHQNYVRSKAQGDGQLKKMDTSTQLIPLGKWLRCTAIDELPQLFNILKGEMSLVGPRPDVVPPEEYQPWQQVRFDVLPGLTGLWQVSGKNQTTFNEMNELDVEYVESRSFWLDAKIIFWTLPAILNLVADDFAIKNKSTNASDAT